jgi:hypothetical protein
MVVVVRPQSQMRSTEDLRNDVVSRLYYGPI